MRITGTKGAVELLRRIYADGRNDREHFVALFLDEGMELLAWKDLSRRGGSRIEVEIDTALLFSVAGASRVIISHNHPRQRFARPSGQDIATTRAIMRLLAERGMRLVDHLIMTADDWYSFRHSGLLDAISG